MSRVAGAVGLLLGLVAVEVAAPTLFPLIVSVILILAPVICWSTVWLLARAGDVDRKTPGDRSQVLEAAFYAVVFVAIASTVGALLGLFAILRVSGVIAPAPQVFLIGIAYVMVLIPGPAVELLRVFRP